MVFVEGDDYRQLRRPGDNPAQFRSPVRLPRADVVDGLVAWYRFEDSTNTAIDATNALGVGTDQTAFDGTVNGASFVENGGVRDVVSDAGTNSGAYSFDGVDDSITVSNVPHQTPLTVMAWIRNDGNGSLNRVVRQSQGSDENYGLNIINDNLVIEAPNGTSSSVTIPTGTLTHLAMTIPNTKGNPVRGFVNGSQVDTFSLSTIYSAQSALGIGDDPAAGNSANLNGLADDVRLYNRALSASEINQIYQNTEPDQ
jgi:hypothetical protein